jgi:branched-chain amino acid transport system permease protein
MKKILPRYYYWIGLTVALALLLPYLPGFTAPRMFENFNVFQFTLVLIYAIALLGLNILTGYNGQISLGHGAFYAIGAYTAAILMDKFNVPYYATLPVAAIVCLIVGFLFGLPALRLEGHYLALATFGLALAVPQLLKYHPLEPWTGGVQGIVLVKPEPPFGMTMSEDIWLYYFTLMVLLVLFWAGRNMLRGRTGRALIAIRDHHMAADTMGINTALYKSWAFGVSAMYTGVAGALGAIAVAFVAPDSFNILVSISLLVGVVIGGLATIPGAIFGGLFIVFTPNYAKQISDAAPWAVYGVVLILFMYLMPFGVWGAIVRGIRALENHRKAAKMGQ